ncbi:hypothetical protein [Rummeliibacillus suwonensis]|uniref:hypothetical protein n=1 Tax=Rummeliibacillus suwonensis TaxID=1306154 RepID=UPI001AAE810F|nr:hypothetical protein [Rummeliibacillus suwonensis]MBO2537026.1 hypothetical protein [Rummeliibacillus suwonensis]
MRHVLWQHLRDQHLVGPNQSDFYGQLIPHLSSRFSLNFEMGVLLPVKAGLIVHILFVFWMLIIPIGKHPCLSIALIIVAQLIHAKREKEVTSPTQQIYTD